MNKKQIDKVRDEGAKNALLEACIGQLFVAKRASEEASMNYFKDFTKRLKAAREALDNAEKFHRAASPAQNESGK